MNKTYFVESMIDYRILVDSNYTLPTVAELELALLKASLCKSKGNITEARKIMGVSDRTIYLKIKKHQLETYVTDLRLLGWRGKVQNVLPVDYDPNAK